MNTLMNINYYFTSSDFYTYDILYIYIIFHMNRKIVWHFKQEVLFIKQINIYFLIFLKRLT